MSYLNITRGVGLAYKIRVQPGFTQLRYIRSVHGVAEQQTGGGEVTGLNVMGERVATLEGKYTSLHSETVRLDGWNKYAIGFGVGTVLLGIGASFFKVLDYDQKQQAEMKEYVKTTVQTSEIVLQSKMDAMESKMESKMSAMESNLLAEIKIMQNKSTWW